MNALYHKLTGQFVPEENLPKEEDATLAQLEVNWKKHPITAKFHKELSDDINALIDSALALSESYHQHNNHLQIIEKLTRANTLRKLKNKYA